jgi:hypothetical protein
MWGEATKITRLVPVAVAPRVSVAVTVMYVEEVQ